MGSGSRARGPGRDERGPGPPGADSDPQLITRCRLRVHSVRHVAGTALAIVLIVAVGFHAWAMGNKAAPHGDRPGNFKKLPPREANALIDRNKGNERFVVLDVRTPDEFSSGHIEGSVNVDFYGPGFQVELGKLDKSKTYLVYCRTGNRSDTTLQMMQELAFTDVYELEGGIKAWAEAGLPVVRSK